MSEKIIESQDGDMVKYGTPGKDLDKKKNDPVKSKKDKKDEDLQSVPTPRS